MRSNRTAQNHIALCCTNLEAAGKKAGQADGETLNRRCCFIPSLYSKKRPVSDPKPVMRWRLSFRVCGFMVTIELWGCTMAFQGLPTPSMVFMTVLEDHLTIVSQPRSKRRLCYRATYILVSVTSLTTTVPLSFPSSKPIRQFPGTTSRATNETS